MIENNFGSRSMKIALFSSRKLGMRPLRSAEKNESGHHVRVLVDVENLESFIIEKLRLLEIKWAEISNLCPPTLRLMMLLGAKVAILLESFLGRKNFRCSAQKKYFYLIRWTEWNFFHSLVYLWNVSAVVFLCMGT